MCISTVPKIFNGEVIMVVVLHEGKNSSNSWKYILSYLSKKKATTCHFRSIYDCIGKIIKNWKKHTFYFFFFIPGSQDEEIAAELSKLVSLICLSLAWCSDFFFILFCYCCFFSIWSSHEVALNIRVQQKRLFSSPLKELEIYRY